MSYSQLRKMDEPIITQQRESIKLIKGQKDSYGWEIKIFIQSVPALGIANKVVAEDDEAVGRLESLNNKLKEKFKVGQAVTKPEGAVTE